MSSVARRSNGWRKICHLPTRSQESPEHTTGTGFKTMLIYAYSVSLLDSCFLANIPTSVHSVPSCEMVSWTMPL